MDHRGRIYNIVNVNYLINTMRTFYNGQVNTQAIIVAKKRADADKKSLEQRAINSDKNSSQ